MARAREREEDEAPKRKKFKYRNYGSEEVRKAANAKSSDYDSYLRNGIPTFKPSNGENNIRILPQTWEDEDRWGRFWAAEIMVHYNVGGDNSSYLCLKQNDENCPVCTTARESEDEKEAKALRAKKRALCWVINRDKPKDGPLLWAMPITVYNEINKHVEKIGKSIGEIKIDDPEEGYDISFEKTGEKDRTDYTAISIAREASELGNEKQVAKWLDYITENPAPDCLVFYDEDHLDKVLSGGARKRKGDDDSEEDEDEPKRKKGKSSKGSNNDDDDDDEPKRKKPKGKKSDDDDESDEEEEVEVEEDDDEDEEEPKSKKGKSNKRASSDDDDDEESEDEESDDDDEDEDEDEPKAKKGKSKGKKSSDDDEDDDEPDEEDEDEDEPKAKKGKKPAKGKSKSDDDEEDDDEESEEDDDEDEPKRKGGNASQRAKEKLAKLKKRKSGR